MNSKEIKKENIPDCKNDNLEDTALYQIMLQTAARLVVSTYMEEIEKENAKQNATRTI